MKNQLLVCGISGALFALCGCGPELAQINYGSEEAQWARGIEKSYPGYRPPRIAPPAIVDNVSPRLTEAEEEKAANVEAIETGDVADIAPAPAADPTADKVAAPAEKSVDPSTLKPDPNAQVGAPAVVDEAAQAAPAAAPAAAGSNLEFTVYTVQAGDSLSKIAKMHYGDARKYDIIVKANGITDPAKVRVGTKLQIPKL